ncbi:MAG: hypothetical protein CMP61_04580 [Flavobacteriales bacterium]|nr:hypothetical protein [Flavobacteriales bacterium]|tara:strand:- start:1011 stop:1682 length:672 start_codon:yes stop_codon:yes gene_type:complete
MGENKISSPKKKLLYVGLFIVPFLVAMALIFVSKGLGTLPIMDMNGKFVQLKHKNPPPYYTVPEFSLPTFTGDTLTFNHEDSILYMITMFPKNNSKEWEKHLMYIGEKIIKRANNVRVIGIYEDDYELKMWSESPLEYVQSVSDKWFMTHASTSEFEKIKASLKLELNDSTNLYDYVMIDKDEHIRAYCSINDAKVARDIPKMFKILSNQYVPRKFDIKQIKN